MKSKNKKNTAYKHNHTYNSNARESEERKLTLLKNMEVKRFQKYVDKQTESMQNYLPPGANKQKIGTLTSIKSK